MAVRRALEVGEGVAVYVTGDLRHLGLMWRLRGQEPVVVDLQFHHSVRQGNAATDSFAVALDVSPLRVPAIVGLAENVAKNARDTIPYGISFAHDCFDAETGRWLLGATGRGLTCATFVVALLKAVGVELVDVGTWDRRDDDDRWRTWVVGVLRQNGHDEQADYVQKQDEGIRIRPGEVAGSALEPASGWSVRYSRAVELAAQLSKAITALS